MSCTNIDFDCNVTIEIMLNRLPDIEKIRTFSTRTNERHTPTQSVVNTRDKVSRLNKKREKNHLKECLISKTRRNQVRLTTLVLFASF